MTKRNNFIWKAIHVVCWFIFVGYCVQTGAILFNYVFSLFKPIGAQNLHLGLDLTELCNNSQLVYTVILFLIIVLSALKAYLFFTVIKTFKMLNWVKPFSDKILAIIIKITGLAFSIGLVSAIAHQIIKRISEIGYNTGMVERYCNDGGAYIMMSAILFVIVLIFQKGIELQNENDLTI